MVGLHSDERSLTLPGAVVLRGARMVVWGEATSHGDRSNNLGRWDCLSISNDRDWRNRSCFQPCHGTFGCVHQKNAVFTLQPCQEPGLFCPTATPRVGSISFYPLRESSVVPQFFEVVCLVQQLHNMKVEDC